MYLIGEYGNRMKTGRWSEIVSHLCGRQSALKSKTTTSLHPCELRRLNHTLGRYTENRATIWTKHPFVSVGTKQATTSTVDLIHASCI